MPERQNSASSTWWFFLLFPEGPDGYGPRQLMFTIATRAGGRMRIADVPLQGFDPHRSLAAGIDRYGAVLPIAPTLSEFARWLTNWVWLPSQLLPATFVLLLFPDGRLPSPRWRFAYGIWEFSPNHAFRFLSTCAVLDGQVLVGAYEIRGSAIHLSPITSDGTTTISVFEVEKPSRMVSKVSIQPRADGPAVVLEVRQRITGMRPGMDGNAFFRTFASRNTTEIQGMPTRREAGGPGGQAASREPRSEPKKGGAKDNDPVLELLKGGE